MNPIYSHLLTFITGLVTGILGSYIANRMSEKAKKRDLIQDQKKSFQKIETKMPQLISKMKNDIKNPKMKSCREFFILPSKSVVFSSSSKPKFFYYEDEYENLLSKIRILESEGFIFDITNGNSPKYQFKEDFIDLLLNVE